MKKPALWLPLFLLVATPAVFAQGSTDPLAPTRDTKSAVEIDREWQQSVAKYDGERNRLLAEAEKQANDRHYRPDWGSLMK
jgi:alpha-L-fucosidase